jgi:isopentenyl phosphate kinase
MAEIVFVKLGGSLITDKGRPRTARPAVIRRIAGALAAAGEGRRFRMIVGHGSGSFGHAAAARYRLDEAVRSREQVAGVSRTQIEARRLNDRVVDALDRAGLSPYVLAPSSFIVARDGSPSKVGVEPIDRALDLGLLPVVFGDVVMDVNRGAAICSTEAVFLALARRLTRSGHRVRRALWLGETDGVRGDPDPRGVATGAAPRGWRGGDRRDRGDGAACPNRASAGASRRCVAHRRRTRGLERRGGGARAPGAGHPGPRCEIMGLPRRSSSKVSACRISTIFLKRRAAPSRFRFLCSRSRRAAR